MFGGFCPFPLRLSADPTHGVSSAQWARKSLDTFALRQVSALAWWTYTKSGATVTVTRYNGQNGSGTANAPTPTVNGTGDVTWTFPDTYSTDYEQSASWQITGAEARAQVATSTEARVYAVTPRTVRIVTKSDPAAVASDSPALVEVF